MIHSIEFYISDNLNIDDFMLHFEVPMEMAMEGYDDNSLYYYLYRNGYSTSYMVLACRKDGKIEIWLDGLASYDDYRFFPFLADSICMYINSEPLYIEGKSVYEIYDEEWIADAIGEEIALLKSTLKIIPKYYQELPLRSGTYFTLQQLSGYGVNLHSSTPRIHGYIQYIISNNLTNAASDEEYASDIKMYSQLSETEVDVPQHVSIGRVKSWQIDGSETWESYSQEDVDLLLELADKYQNGKAENISGVVLNDIGTIYQVGIGVPADGYKAEYWFKEAIKKGDRLYAASNLGDLYRKGCGTLLPCLRKAFEAYIQSVDYYAVYRVGQAYEEGWTGAPDKSEAMRWYRLAAEKGHHLAIKRLAKEN